MLSIYLFICSNGEAIADNVAFYGLRFCAV